MLIDNKKFLSGITNAEIYRWLSICRAGRFCCRFVETAECLILSVRRGLHQTLLQRASQAQYQYTSPDSIIFTANYEINLPVVQTLNLEKYNGKILLTISQSTDGTYKIVRWTDFQASSDAIYHSWSVLKARYYN